MKYQKTQIAACLVFAARCYASAAYVVTRHAVSVCPSVCPSRSWIVSKRINISSQKIFTVGIYTILVFLYQTAWQYSGGVDCRWGRLKSRNHRLSGLAINNCCTVVCISHSAAGFLFTTGIGRPSAIDALLRTVRDRPSAVSRHTQSRLT